MPIGMCSRLAIFLALCVIAPCVASQTLSPYSVFQGMALADMDSLRVKLTYGGPQTTGVPTLCLKVSGAPLSLDAFAPFRRSGFLYANEAYDVNVLAASRQELRAILDNVDLIPGVTDGGADTDGTLSFALLSTTGGSSKVFESVLDSVNSRALFGALLATFDGNATTTRELRGFGCAIGCLPSTMPTDVSGQVSVSLTGLRRDRYWKDQYVGIAKVKNTSATTIYGPLTLVVMRSGGNADLLSSEGTTCNIHPVGADFLTLGIGSGLAPNATTSTLLRFSNPSLMRFDVRFRVFAGPGTR